MGHVMRGAVLCLIWGLAGALLVFVPGVVLINWAVQAGSHEGSDLMGLAIMMAYVLTPLGFILGAVAGGMSIRRARRRDRDAASR